MVSVIGSLARNPHQGSRTEYLAQYFFSGLGSAVPVPHQEDSGIDLYCTLGTPDPNEPRRLLCGHPFYVQVKSKANPIEYTNQQAIEWLTSLPQPYFICVVTQQTLGIQIYHSLPIFFVTMQRQLPEKLVFELGENHHWATTDEENKGNWPLKIYDSKSGKFSVTAPILDFTMADIVGSDDWYAKAHQILESWLKLSEFNIAMRTVGLPIVRYPDKYKTNEPLAIVDHTNEFVIAGGSYTESYNPEYAREKKDFKSLLKRTYASLLFLREPDEVGDKTAWLLEQELKSDGIFDQDQSDPYNAALVRYKISQMTTN